ncbi:MULTISPECIES: tyrosine-type recombinase/integrase [Streptomyces]|uniref:tyrosine-type recombinase/integrase n=1 Tax=Streptomyces TaxID=1883 RepID=UPI00114CA420|nr:site-specific integrase [Streptomyces sp. SceaMP-e96]MYT17474.1 tyrosine-type recombinase/integrase [Streptomyces sp. SID4951]
MATVLDKGAGAPGKRWVVRYREPGGRSARQRQKAFDRKKDAVDFATKVENDKRENTYIDPNAGKVSLRRYTEDWLNGVLLSGGTWESYERILRLHVLPHLGRKTIAQVTAADVEALYARWAKGGAKPNTIDARSIALSSLFSHAVRHRRISSNPVKEAEKPDNPVVPVDERSLPSLEEIKAIAHAIGPRLEPAVWLMACGGLRIGESLGVFPEDFQDGMLRLRRQIVRYRDEDGLYVARYAPLKHRKEGEWRDVPVPEFFTAFADRFPILNQQGGMTYPGLVRASWDRAIKRLGLRKYTPHDLRHKWATVTLTNGVSIHEVSRWLGHRSIKVTVDRYGHLTQDGRERCRQVVAATFEGYLPEELSVGLAA